MNVCRHENKRECSFFSLFRFSMSNNRVIEYKKVHLQTLQSAETPASNLFFYVLWSIFQARLEPFFSLSPEKNPTLETRPETLREILQGAIVMCISQLTSLIGLQYKVNTTVHRKVNKCFLDLFISNNVSRRELWNETIMAICLNDYFLQSTNQI